MRFYSATLGKGVHEYTAALGKRVDEYTATLDWSGVSITDYGGWEGCENYRLEWAGGVFEYTAALDRRVETII